MGKKVMRISKAAVMKMRSAKAAPPPVKAMFKSGEVVEADLIGMPPSVLPPEKKKVEDVIRETGEASMTAMKMMFWKLQYASAGETERRVQGTENRAEKLSFILEEAGITWDRLSSMTNKERITLFSRLHLRPTERIWITAMLRNRPCGSIVLSQDGKHICLRQREKGNSRCPTHSTNGGNDAPPTGAPRAAIRQFFGRSLYPVYEIYQENEMQNRAATAYGPTSCIDTIGHAVEVLELSNSVREKQIYLGADEGTIGGEEDSTKALTMWSYILGDTLEEMETRAEAKRFEPLKDPTRVFETTVIRCEFDKGGPGEYQKRVEKRKEEWAKWAKRVQRDIHLSIESFCTYTGAAQPTEPPSVQKMQNAVDSQDRKRSVFSKAPSPLELRTPHDEKHFSERIFRPLDPSRAVVEADRLPVMPSIVVQARVSLRPDDSKSHIGGSLAMSFKVLIHSESCFTRPKQLLDSIKKKLAHLPVPPAMIQFNMLFRVDPLEMLLHQYKTASMGPSNFLPKSDQEYLDIGS